MWCRAIGCLVTLTLSILVVPFASEAQQPVKVYRIGWLISGISPSEPGPTAQPFRQALRELGYVEGQNLVIESRWAEGNPERLPDLATELVRLKVDVLVAGGSAATRAAQHATRTIPIVMTNSSDPVRLGFVASLAQPGGNITGLSSLAADLSGKHLELLTQTVPDLSRIAVLVNPADAGTLQSLHEMQVAAQAVGIQLHVLEVRQHEDLQRAFVAIQQEGAGALIVLGDPFLLTPYRRDIAALALQNRLPTMYPRRMGVEAGVLMSYGASLPDLQRRAATYVDKILKGAKPADLPVEQPMKFELVINLKTAKALGITMPPSLLLLADEVIQ
jgi:putative ABC transport system substrate-binding protein